MDADISFPENWKPPSELAGAVPRETSISGVGIFKIILAALVIVAAVPLYLFMRKDSADQAARNQALREHGVATTGEIAQLWHQGRSRTPMVAYAFTANGVRLRGDARVPDALWDHVRLAGMIPIRYLPSEPGINHPTQWEESVDAVWVAFCLPAIFLVCAVLLIANLRKQASLLADGLPAPAVIFKFSRIKNGWMANYLFRLKDGTRATGRTTLRRQPVVGTVMCVLYDPEKPARNRVYPVDSYRVA